MISATRAKAEGYTIDNHAAGRPIAYKGNRFAPTDIVSVLTDEEEQLLAALAWALPFADESITRDLSDGAVGMGEDLAQLHAAQKLLKELAP